jgi:DNA-binding transcriptional MerR regulator
MKMYSPGEIATALKVSASSIRNWTEQEEIQEFLSDMAARRGSYQNAKQREYSLQDLYVMNTVAKKKTRHNSWAEVADILRDEGVDKELPPSAALVMQETAAEGFADRIILHQRIEFLEQTIKDQEQEIDHLRSEVERVRKEERDISREEREELQSAIGDLNRLIGKLEAQMEMYKEQAKEQGGGDD